MTTAAQMTHNGEALIDVVGMGETQDEALAALKENWIADVMAQEVGMEVVTRRTAEAWWQDILTGDDAELAVVFIEFDDTPKC